MADSIGADFSGLRNLAADLGALADSAIPNVAKALRVTAQNVKEDWRDDAKRIDRGHAKAYPSSIDYDIKTEKAGEISAEIGPNLAKNQGSLGFLEEAPGRVANAPQGNARRALAKNVEDFERGILKAVGGVSDVG
jgi:hypothetical protein